MPTNDEDAVIFKKNMFGGGNSIENTKRELTTKKNHDIYENTEPSDTDEDILHQFKSY